MRYNLLLNYPEPGDELTPEMQAEGQRAFDHYAKSLDEAGVLISINILQPSTATTTVRQVDGALSVQDGPFADTKERLGGIFVIDVPDLDAAIAWAEKSPTTGWGPVEIRPTALTFVDGAWLPLG